MRMEKKGGEKDLKESENNRAMSEHEVLSRGKEEKGCSSRNKEKGNLSELGAKKGRSNGTTQGGKKNRDGHRSGLRASLGNDTANRKRSPGWDVGGWRGETATTKKIKPKRAFL